MGYIGKQPTSVPLTSSDVADGIITSAKITDGTIALADLSATGTKDATTFLRGDNSFAQAGGGMWEFISSQTVTSAVAQIDFTSLSTDYEDFCFVVSNMRLSTDNVRVYIRFFTSAGIKDGSVYDYATITKGSATVNEDEGATTYTRMTSLAGDATVESISGEVTLYDVHETTFHKKFFVKSVYDDNSERFKFTVGGGELNETSAITGIRFLAQSGNIRTCDKISMYGRKNS